VETVERFDELPVRHGGETQDPTIDSDHGVLRLLGDGDLPLCLSGEATAVRSNRDGDDFEDAFYVAAFETPQPAKLGQEKAGVGLIKLELLKIRAP
jgi:hypothetical protein